MYGRGEDIRHLCGTAVPTVLECDRQTDGQTDGQRSHIIIVRQRIDAR